MKNNSSFVVISLAVLTLQCLGASLGVAKYKHPDDISPSFFISAHLIDKSKNAAKGVATVEVTVRGIRLVDPELAHQESRSVEGHLHYQLDDEAVIATQVTKLSFHGLSIGDHKISVYLADENYMPMGMPTVLMVTISDVKTVKAY